MKKYLLALALCALAQAEGLNGELRAFSFDRSFNNTAPHSRALTLGGVVKYTTPVVYDVSATVGYYASSNTNYYRYDEGKASGMVRADGEDLAFIGEANVKYDTDKVQVVFGRQRLATPLANDHDLRMLPSSYYGATAMYKPWGIQIGHITKYTGFCSKWDEFRDIPTFDYVYFSKYGVNAQIALSDVRNYYYGDYTYGIGNLSLKAQAGANDNAIGKDSRMYGLKVSYKIHDTTMSVFNNEITGARWLAIESGAMFTDFMQGYGPYEPSTALGMSISNTTGALTSALSIADVRGGVTDSYTEYQGDVIYQINKENKARVRYSQKHQSPTSNREDRNDLRIIYYYTF